MPDPVAAAVAAPATAPTPAEAAPLIGAPADPATPAAAGGDPELLLGAPPAAVEPTPFDAEKFTYPEGFEFTADHKTFLAETAKKYNIPMQAVEAFVGQHVKEAQAISDRVQGLVDTAWNETLSGWKTESQKQFGTDLPAVIAKCEGVIGQFGGQPFLDILRTTGLGNNPVMIGMLAKIADAIGEPTPVNPKGEPMNGHPLAAMYPSMAAKPQ
jgi:hypothetical protein